MNHLDGYVVQNWQRIRDVFEQNFIDQLDIGAGLCIYYQGKCVVDLYGGWKDTYTKTEPYTSDTLQLIYSTSKGVAAAAIALCVERGWLNYQSPVAQYWPEFAANSKQDITVGDLLAHRAGLSYIDAELTFDDALNWSRMTSLIAAQKPHWKPGSMHGYHAHTIGYAAGELISRVDPLHRSYGQFIRDEFDREFYVGIPDNRLEQRISPLLQKEVDTTDDLPEDPEIEKSSSCNGALPLGLPQMIFNDPRLHRAQLPAVNGITNARVLARIYARLLSDVEENGQTLKCFLSDRTRAEATKDITPEGEPDRNWDNLPSTFSQSGFQTYGRCFNALREGIFGHCGFGGSCAFAFPPLQLAYAYVCNYLDPSQLAIDPRSIRVIDAIEQILHHTYTVINH